MKKFIFFILLTITSEIYCQTICHGTQVIPVVTFNQCNSNNWVLCFEDNFDGESLNLDKWVTDRCRNRYCNDEQQYYTNEGNYQVNNGTLKLILKRETIYGKTVEWLPENEHLFCNGQDRGLNARYFYFTSANIETVRTFTHGRYEASIKIPKGKGFWPAFWMWGGDPVYNEIDVFEFWNENDIWGNYDSDKLSKYHKMNMHFDYDGDGNKEDCPSKYEGGDFSLESHVFTVYWEKNKVQWLVDGVLKRTDYKYYTILGQTTGCTIEAWHQYMMNTAYTIDPMYIILNVAIQSGINSPETSTVFPSQMEVDWVRYYQRHPCQDISITNSNQFTINNPLYNVMVGDDIEINCPFTVQSGEQLAMLGKNSVKLRPGFKAEFGSSTYNAKIEQTVCGSLLDYLDPSIEISDNLKEVIQNPSIQKGINLDKTDDYINAEYSSINEIDNINVYPNPNDGSFNIDFCSDKFSNYKIQIRDMEGKLIFFLNQINSEVINIQLINEPSGIYILYLYDFVDKSTITHKIIKQ